ncbi:MAG: hypothetical protein ACOYVK_00555 [Bacillota bacterium]
MDGGKELQTMQNQNVSLIEHVDVSKLAGLMQKISNFQAVVQQTLKSEHDYGIIPGTSKPTLLKPGAEKILMLMGITSMYDITDKVQDYEKGFFAYTVKCLLFKGEQRITEGFGHCNTKEDRYRWRWVKESDLPMGADRTRLKSRLNRFGQLEFRVENEDSYTLANTCLKMAKKRAQIDATLAVASLSEIFTQDLEDMRDFIQQEQTNEVTEVEVQNMRLTFGKHRGKTLLEVFEQAPDYIEWLAEKAADPTVRKAATELLVKKEIQQVKDGGNRQSASHEQIGLQGLRDSVELPF